MDRRQKMAMRWTLYVGIVAAIALIAALIVGQDAFETQPPDTKERAEAIEESAFTDKEKAGIEALVHDYIVDHPEVVSEAIDELNRRQVAGRISDAGDGIARPFASAYIGRRDAPLTLVEFTDYACGFCRRSVDDVSRLVRENDDVRVVFRETPILSPQSKQAALWALAAAEQGRYEPFHRALFNAGSPTDEAIKRAAKQAGMDIDKAREQIRQPEYQAELQRNVGAMRTIGASGTPTFLIGDQLIEGAVGYDALEEAVEKAREG